MQAETQKTEGRVLGREEGGVGKGLKMPLLRQAGG